MFFGQSVVTCTKLCLEARAAHLFLRGLIFSHNHPCHGRVSLQVVVSSKMFKLLRLKPSDYWLNAQI